MGVAKSNLAKGNEAFARERFPTFLNFQTASYNSHRCGAKGEREAPFQFVRSVRMTRSHRSSLIHTSGRALSALTRSMACCRVKCFC